VAPECHFDEVGPPLLSPIVLDDVRSFAA
jgi:hypothetical protein